VLKSGRWTATPLKPSAALLTGRSPLLPVGRTRIQVVLSDAATGLSSTAARTVTVRRP
jgi:hypothetical protein